MGKKDPDTHPPLVRNEMSVSGCSQASSPDAREDIRRALGLSVGPALSCPGQLRVIKWLPAWCLLGPSCRKTCPEELTLAGTPQA